MGSKLQNFDPNLLGDFGSICKNILRLNAEDVDGLRPKVGVPSRIAVHRQVMHLAVDLNAEPHTRNVEVEHEPAHGKLSPNLDPDMPGPKTLPGQHLGQA